MAMPMTAPRPMARARVPPVILPAAPQSFGHAIDFALIQLRVDRNGTDLLGDRFCHRQWLAPRVSIRRLQVDGNRIEHGGVDSAASEHPPERLSPLCSHHELVIDVSA